MCRCDPPGDSFLQLEFADTPIIKFIREKPKTNYIFSLKLFEQLISETFQGSINKMTYLYKKKSALNSKVFKTRENYNIKFMLRVMIQKDKHTKNSKSTENVKIFVFLKKCFHFSILCNFYCLIFKLNL